MRFLKLIIFFTLSSFFSFGQITTTVSPSAAALANAVVGFGVTVTNASLTCPNGASAIYANAGSSSLGASMGSGILLSTGSATAAFQPAGSMSSFLGIPFYSSNQADVSNGTGGDALMDALTGQGPGSSNDRCRLEFDMTGQCNNLLIKYRFASEEYPEYVGGGVNDAFGFFISGPNPSGGSYVNQNIATVPGQTNIAVSIETVNNGSADSGPCTNCAYYVSQDGVTTPVIYDGMTTLLTASANITPCSSYHIILEIADGGDDAFDSGVFLQFGGFSCPTPTITTNAAASSCTANTGSASVNVTGITPASYSWSPGGQTTSSITNQGPGTYTCAITFTNGICAPIVQTKTITITSPGVTPTVAVSSNTPCAGSTLSLTSTSNGTIYSWLGPNTFTSNIQNPTISNVPATAAGIYTLSVTNAGGCITTKTLNISLAPSPSIAATSGVLCDASSSATLTASGATNYTWSPATGLNATTGSVVVANPSSSTTYSITGETGGCVGTTTTNVLILGNPTVSISSGSICSGSSITLTASGATNYTWSSSTSLSANSGSVVSANPNVTETYTVIGANGSCTNSATTTVTVVTTPTLSSTSASICAGETNTLSVSGANSYNWLPTTGLSTTTGSIVNANPSSTTVYTITGANGSCTNTITSTMTVIALPSLTLTSGDICAGQTSATLTANGANNYTWSPSATLSSTSGSVVIANPTITTSYTVTGELATCTNTAITSVSVTAIPTLSTSDATICSGTSATLTITGANNYTWTPNIDLSATTGSVINANPNSNQSYTITGAVGSCTSIAVSNVSVIITPTLSTSSTSICSGESATLTVNGAQNYTWTPNSDLSTNSGSITIANPNVSTTYTITGTNSVCSSTIDVLVNVTQTPTISLTSQDICSGSTTATLTASGAQNYTWSPASSLSTSTGSIVTATPTSATDYTVVGANGACTNTAITTVSVLPTPTLTSTSNTICSGTSGTLSVTGASNYTWSPASTLSSSSGTLVTANPMSTETYTIIGMLGTCTNSTTVVMGVTATPTVSANSPSICSGSSANLTAIGATNYTWSPTATLSGTLGNLVSANPSVTTTYTIIGETGSCTSSFVTTVNVTTTPTISATSGSICSGNLINLTANGAANFAWTPSSSLSTSTGSVVSANPTTTTTYTILGANGVCTNSTVTTVSVTTTPTISLTSGTICAGASYTLNASGAAVYTWSPASSLSSSSGSVVSANPNTTTTYSVIGANGACTNTSVTTLTVMPFLNISTIGNQEICLGQTQVLYAGGGTTYSWSPAITIIQSKDSIITVMPPATTIYTVTVSKPGMCSKSSTIEVIVNPLPIIDAGHDTTINIDETVTLLGTGDVEVGFLTPENTYLDCNFCSSVTVNPQESTCYVLTGKNDFGCRSFDTVCVTVTKDFNVYIPNTFTPNGDSKNDVFYVQGYGLKDVHLSIYNRWGELLFQSDATNPGWDGTFKGAPCEQGVYVFKVEALSMGGQNYRKVGHINLISKLK